MRRAAAALGAALALVAPATAHAIERSCAWTAQVSGDQVNAAYPDEAANYWIAIVPIPDGGHIELRGRYPHARYMSLHTYTPATQAIDALADVEIRPDGGSSNPFLERADRTAEHRDWTVRVVDERVPAEGRTPNTLYTENADGSKSSKPTRLAGIELRVYEPDLGRDVAGGVGLPELAVVTAAGERTVVPALDVTLPAAGLTQTSSMLSPPASTPRAGLLADPEPRWRKYTNVATLQGAIYAGGETLGPPVGDPLTGETDAHLPSGGAGENMHNKYIYATFSREYGDVLVLHGKLPTTPRTRDGQPVMGGGQLRYWSLCANGQATNVYGCLTDDEVVVDEDGWYTIAVTAGAQRPRNATDDCGISWLPAGPAPQMVLLMRNMLPAPDFAQAIQRVEPGRERAGMGDYYPAGRYVATVADAERELGCAAR